MILWVLLENPLGESVFIFRAIYCASRLNFDKNDRDIEQVPVTISESGGRKTRFLLYVNLVRL